MNVLLVSSTLDDDGGMPVCVGRLGVALAQAGHRVAIAGQRWGEPSPAIAAARQAPGVEVIDIRQPWTVVGQIAAARQMAGLVGDWLRRHGAGREPAVVHTHGVWTPAIIAAAEAVRGRSAALAVSPHGMLRRAAMHRSQLVKQLAWTTFVRREIAWAHAVHATSAQEADDLRSRAGPGLHPRVIPWGIDAIESAPLDHRGRQGRRVASYVGRMLPIKGLDMLVDAWAAVRPAGWVLRLAGPCDAAMRGELERRIAALGLAAVVSIEPAFPRHDLPRVLAEASLVVCPSRSENFSLVVGEALAAGVPVITTSETAWRDVSRKGCGWCVPPDTAALTAALASATASTEETLAEMGRSGRAWIADDFTWNAVAARIVRELYRPGS